MELHIGPLLEQLHEARRERDAAQVALAQLRARRILSVVFGHHKGAPRPFALHRRSDRKFLALGAEFPDGAVALRLAADGGWTTTSEGGTERIAVYNDAEVVWLSDELEPLARAEEEIERLRAELETVKGAAGRRLTNDPPEGD